MAEGVHRAGERLGDAVQHLGRLPAAQAVQQQAELVAAEAGDHVALADGLAQPLGDHDQQGVPDGVAEPVVDRLEVVEVDERQAERLTRDDRVEGLAGLLLEQGPVGEVGQIVVAGSVGELGLVAVELYQVGVHPAQQPTVLPERVDLPEHHQGGEQDGAERDGEHGAAGGVADHQQQHVGGGDGHVRHGAEGAAAPPRRRHPGGPALPVGGEDHEEQGAGYEHLRAALTRANVEQHGEQRAAGDADGRGGREQAQRDAVRAAGPADRDLDEGERADQAEGHQHDHGYGGRAVRVPRVPDLAGEVPDEDGGGDADDGGVEDEADHDAVPLGAVPDRHPQQGPEQDDHREGVADRGRQVVQPVRPVRVRHGQAGVADDAEHDQDADDGQGAPHPAGVRVEAGRGGRPPAGPAGDRGAHDRGQPAPDGLGALLGHVDGQQDDRPGEYGDSRDQQRSGTQPLHPPFVARRHRRVVLPPSVLPVSQGQSVEAWPD
nr:hypothetical protein GCM10020092_027570 [Actinoplanes digitatis]